MASRQPNRKRIDIGGSQEPLAGLEGAFSGIEISGLPAGPAPAPKGAPSVWKMGRVVLRKETARRGGKTVIVVHDFATHLPASVIDSVAKKLRTGCACGGAVKDRTIEIQADQPAKIRALLEAEGFEVAGVK